MADLKISELTNLTAADPVSDMLPIVDVSATPPASGSTKRISINNLLSSSPTASGALTVTGLVTAGSATITGAATVGTTLGVTGASTLASVGVTGAATVGTTLLVGTNATLTNGNVIIGTSGKGIDFSAVTGGTGTATGNVLNDYEEGTWTGTLSGSTAAPTTPVTATGKYTKIGRQVSIQIAFLAVDTTGASSRILVTGLPFAASSSPNGITGSVLIDAMATFTGSPSVYLTSSSTQIDLYASVSNGAIASVTHNAGAAKSLWLNVTYTV